MMADNVRSSSFSFAGLEYIVSMSVYNGSQLTVQIEDQLSADQWRNTFDAKCELLFHTESTVIIFLSKWWCKTVTVSEYL